MLVDFEVYLKTKMEKISQLDAAAGIKSYSVSEKYFSHHHQHHHQLQPHHFPLKMTGHLHHHQLPSFEHYSSKSIDDSRASVYFTPLNHGASNTMGHNEESLSLDSAHASPIHINYIDENLDLAPPSMKGFSQMLQDSSRGSGGVKKKQHKFTFPDQRRAGGRIPPQRLSGGGGGGDEDGVMRWNFDTITELNGERNAMLLGELVEKKLRRDQRNKLRFREAGGNGGPGFSRMNRRRGNAAESDGDGNDGDGIYCPDALVLGLGGGLGGEQQLRRQRIGQKPLDRGLSCPATSTNPSFLYLLRNNFNVEDEQTNEAVMMADAMAGPSRNPTGRTSMMSKGAKGIDKSADLKNKHVLYHPLNGHEGEAIGMNRIVLNRPEIPQRQQIVEDDENDGESEDEDDDDDVNHFDKTTRKPFMSKSLPEIYRARKKSKQATVKSINKQTANYSNCNDKLDNDNAEPGSSRRDSKGIRASIAATAAEDRNKVVHGKHVILAIEELQP